MPPQKRVSLPFLCLPPALRWSFLASQVALLLLTSHVGLCKRWNVYIYHSQDHGRLLLHLHQQQQQQTLSQSTFQPSLPESSELYINIPFYHSHPSRLVSRKITPCRRIVPPTATTNSELALPLAQNVPLRELFTITTLTWVLIYSLQPFLPFSFSFSSSKASNGRLGLIWLPWALDAWVKQLVQQLP